MIDAPPYHWFFSLSTGSGPGELPPLIRCIVDDRPVSRARRHLDRHPNYNLARCANKLLATTVGCNQRPIRMPQLQTVFPPLVVVSLNYLDNPLTSPWFHTGLPWLTIYSYVLDIPLQTAPSLLHRSGFVPCGTHRTTKTHFNGMGSAFLWADGTHLKASVCQPGLSTLWSPCPTPPWGHLLPLLPGSSDQPHSLAEPLPCNQPWPSASFWSSPFYHMHASGSESPVSIIVPHIQWFVATLTVVRAARPPSSFRQ